MSNSICITCDLYKNVNKDALKHGLLYATFHPTCKKPSFKLLPSLPTSTQVPRRTLKTDFNFRPKNDKATLSTVWLQCSLAYYSTICIYVYVQCYMPYDTENVPEKTEISGLKTLKIIEKGDYRINSISCTKILRIECHLQEELKQ